MTSMRNGFVVPTWPPASVARRTTASAEPVADGRPDSRPLLESESPAGIGVPMLCQTTEP